LPSIFESGSGRSRFRLGFEAQTEIRDE